MTTTSIPMQRKNDPLTLISAAIVGGAMLFAAAVLAWVVGFNVYNFGRIFPGVSVAGVDISGLQPAEAALKLNRSLTYHETGRLLFRDGDNVWIASPAELGMVFDPAASARAAYQVGRSGGPFVGLERQITALQSGVDVSPVLVLDERVAYQYLQRISAQVDQPVIEASLSVQGTEIVAQPGQIGRSLHLEATMTFLNAQLSSFRDGEVQLVIQEIPPEVLDISGVAETARGILNEPLTLTLPGSAEGNPGPWTVDLPALAPLLVIERVRGEDGTTFQLGFNSEGLRPVLTELADSVNRSPKNAKFIFNDDTRQLDLMEAGLDGRTVDIDASLKTISQGILQGQKNIPLVVNIQRPQVPSDATGEQLGIRELVSQQSSYFYGSSAARIQNIQTAAAQFHGILIPPGETFSMGEILGDVSLENGYAEALIIYGNRTIKGVGGGVCQVSTTLFRTVFFGGFPIVERYPHAYRVYYYEQRQGGGIDPRMAGLDATVYFPLVDFKFTNDTPYWLLMETYVNVAARRLTWKFYSTSDGRSVQWETTGPQNVVEAPRPLFQENPELGKDQIKQVDWAAEGADVVVTRRVLRSGQVIIQDTIRTHYQAWQAIYEYGPGTEDPERLVENR